MNQLEELKIKIKALSTSIELLRLAKYGLNDTVYLELVKELNLIQERIKNLRSISIHITCEI